MNFETTPWVTMTEPPAQKPVCYRRSTMQLLPTEFSFRSTVAPSKHAQQFNVCLCIHSARIPPFPDRTSAALHCSYLRQVRTKGMVQWRLLFTNT